MGNLEQHARHEMELAGLFDADADYNGMIGDAVMGLVRAFAAQGHSGFSARQTLAVFQRVAAHKTLSPLTSSPDEWMEVGEVGGVMTWQNRRQSSCFSSDGGKTYHDIDEPLGEDGQRVIRTSSEPPVRITTPLTDTAVIHDMAGVPVVADGPTLTLASPVEEVRRDTAMRVDLIAVKRDDGTPGVCVAWAAQVGPDRLEGVLVGDPTNEDARGMLAACWDEYQEARIELDIGALEHASNTATVADADPAQAEMLHGATGGPGGGHEIPGKPQDG